MYPASQMCKLVAVGVALYFVMTTLVIFSHLSTQHQFQAQMKQYRDQNFLQVMTTGGGGKGMSEEDKKKIARFANMEEELDTLKSRLQLTEERLEEVLYDRGSVKKSKPEIAPVEYEQKGKYYTRDITDTRNPACLDIKYAVETFPAVSIIIVTHNEEDSLVLRTVRSVLERTPARLLKEIIVVDDASTPPLFSEVAVQDKTIVHKNYEQVGLIRARTQGVDMAKGEVLVFLDAHCEANVGWLEPLLHEVVTKPGTLAWPIIDGIHHTTYAYTTGYADYYTHAFELKTLRDISCQIPPHVKAMRKTAADPIPTPTHPGGLFAMSRKHWDEWGGYDLDMGFYGTENTDQSVRVWICGGSVVLVPCSHVGHVFRDSKRVPDYVRQTTKKGKIRFAEVWMDDYKFPLYKNLGIDERQITAAGDMSKMKELRKAQKCHDFKWFHQNVYPHMELPYELLEPGLDIAWPDVFSSGKIAGEKPSRAVVTSLNPTQEDMDGAAWIVYSLTRGQGVEGEAGVQNTDLYIFLEANARDYIPTGCEYLDERVYAMEQIEERGVKVAHKNLRCFALAVEIPDVIAEIPNNYAKEIYALTEEAGFQPLLSQYQYIMKTDIKSFFTEQFETWYPPADKFFQVGKGAYVHDDLTKNNIYDIANDMHLQTQHAHNFGQTWYGPSDTVLKVATLSLRVLRFILENYFQDNGGSWPSWYKGVAHKYASEIAINNFVDVKHIETTLVDGPTNTNARTCTYAHLRATEGKSGMFSLGDYLMKTYDGQDVDDFNLANLQNYAGYVALKSTRRDKAQGYGNKMETNMC